MTNKEILEMLSENEERLFYASIREKTDELKAAHAAAKQALEAFAKAIGYIE